MSTDLQLRQEVTGVLSCTVKVSLSPSPAPAQAAANADHHTPTAKIESAAGIAVKEENCLITPSSPSNMIPKVEGCPPAPRKAPPVRAPTCKRKLSDFFEAVSRDEIQSFFRQVKPNSGVKKMCQLV